VCLLRNCDLSTSNNGISDPDQGVFYLKPLNLSEVEIAVLYMIVRGCPATEVRQRLNLSDEQIRVHMSTIYKALAVSGKTELLSLADHVAAKSGVPRQPRAESAA
jgi:DNA-binding NarL/FixJ family response regulator